MLVGGGGHDRDGFLLAVLCVRRVAGRGGRAHPLQRDLRLARSGQRFSVPSRGGPPAGNSLTGPLSLQYTNFSSSRSDGGGADGRQADLVQRQHSSSATSPCTGLPAEAVRGELRGTYDCRGLHEMHQWGCAECDRHGAGRGTSVPMREHAAMVVKVIDLYGKSSMRCLGTL